MSLYAPNCMHCHPRPVVIHAANKAHAATLIRRAERVYVSCEVAPGQLGLFKTTKKEALAALARAPDGCKPEVRYHHLTAGGAAFIG